MFLTFLIVEAGTLAVTMEMKMVNFASNKQSSYHAGMAGFIEISFHISYPSYLHIRH